MQTQPSSFQEVLDTLGDQFGKLNNQIEHWADHHHSLINLFPEIEQALSKRFKDGSAPISIFGRGRDTYKKLLTELAESNKPDRIITDATAFLNLRFYILLNAFLQACQESVEKYKLNQSLDLEKLVETSYYTPYFFDRGSATSAEMVRMLEEDLSKLGSAPRDRGGILLALRIRNGVYATLAESYCPLHPILYPLVQELDAIKASNDPDVIKRISAKLQELLQALQDQ